MIVNSLDFEHFLISVSHDHLFYFCELCRDPPYRTLKEGFDCIRKYVFRVKYLDAPSLRLSNSALRKVLSLSKTP